MRACGASSLAASPNRTSSAASLTATPFSEPYEPSPERASNGPATPDFSEPGDSGSLPPTPFSETGAVSPPATPTAASISFSDKGSSPAHPYLNSPR